MKTIDTRQLRKNIELEIERVTEIDYSKDPRNQQREGALAFKGLLSSYLKDQVIDDPAQLALILVRLRDLQVRDFALGSTTSENIDLIIAMFQEVIDLAPSAYIAPVATMLSVAAYERSNGDLARSSLELALNSDCDYPLALLLERVYQAGWPAESFAQLRSELHPKIEAALFGD